MKTLRMVCGTICCCLFILIVVQSCAAGISNTINGSEEVSGTAGFFTAIMMLVAGVLSIVGKKSNGVTITAICFYIVAGMLACTLYGSFKDLKIYGVLDFIFAILLLFSVFLGEKKQKIEVVNKTESEADIRVGEDNNIAVSSKSRLKALLLSIFLGGLGIHNFYLGQIIKGIVRIIMFIVGSAIYIYSILIRENASYASDSSIVALLAFTVIFFVYDIWIITEIIIIASGKARDAKGLLVKKWK